MEDKVILAKDARAIADSTNSLLNHIYKCVKESAKQGICHLYWGIEDCSEALIQNTISSLKSTGYEVDIEIYTDDNDIDHQIGLNINW